MIEISNPPRSLPHYLRTQTMYVDVPVALDILSFAVAGREREPRGRDARKYEAPSRTMQRTRAAKTRREPPVSERTEPSRLEEGFCTESSNVDRPQQEEENSSLSFDKCRKYRRSSNVSSPATIVYPSPILEGLVQRMPEFARSTCFAWPQHRLHSAKWKSANTARTAYCIFFVCLTAERSENKRHEPRTASRDK